MDVVSSWVSQENPVRKPWFRLARILWVSRWERMWRQMIRSRILQGTDVREMGREFSGAWRFPFLKAQLMFACSQSGGRVPLSRERWWMALSAGAIGSAQVFRTVFGMPSGPGALWGLSSRSNLATPAVEMVS